MAKEGNVIHYLRVIRRDPTDKKRWICLCRCGVEKSYHNSALVETKSCGCWNLETRATRGRTHGMSWKRPEYAIWIAMKQRCTNPNNRRYKDYGGRGITVCQRWASSFENFLEDVGARPANDLALERINNEKGYFPKNVKWASKRTQQRNMRSNRLLTIEHSTKTIAEWSDLTGLKYSTIEARVRRGWPMKDVLSPPLPQKGTSIQ